MHKIELRYPSPGMNPNRGLTNEECFKAPKLSLLETMRLWNGFDINTLDNILSNSLNTQECQSFYTAESQKMQAVLISWSVPTITTSSDIMNLLNDNWFIIRKFKGILKVQR